MPGIVAHQSALRGGRIHEDQGLRESAGVASAVGSEGSGVGFQPSIPNRMSRSTNSQITTLLPRSSCGRRASSWRTRVDAPPSFTMDATGWRRLPGEVCDEARRCGLVGLIDPQEAVAQYQAPAMPDRPGRWRRWPSQTPAGWRPLRRGTTLRSAERASFWQCRFASGSRSAEPRSRRFLAVPSPVLRDGLPRPRPRSRRHLPTSGCREPDNTAVPILSRTLLNSSNRSIVSTPALLRRAIRSASATAPSMFRSGVGSACSPYRLGFPGSRNDHQVDASGPKLVAEVQDYTGRIFDPSTDC